MSERKRSLSSVPMELKLEALKRLENGETLEQVAAEFNVGRSTVFDWKRNKSKIELWCSQQGGDEFLRMRRRMKASAYHKVNEALYQWYLTQKEQGVRVTGHALKMKALDLYVELKDTGDSGFTASNGWLDRWKQRYGLVKPSSFGKSIAEPITILQEGVTSEKIDPVDSENLTESSHQPTASTSRKASATVTSAASPQTIVKKSTIGKNSETQKISVRPVTQVAITTKPTNDETAKLQEKIKQLEERNIQLEIENESYRIKNVMLETQKKKLIGQLQTIIKKKDPLDLGENTLVYEQHSERLTVGPSTSSATLSGKPQISGSSATHSQDFSDVNDAGDDNAFLHSMEASEIEIDVDPEFETVDIKPNILLDNLPPLPPSPVPTKRRKRNSDQLETASSAAGKRSKSDQSCDFGDDDGDDDFQPDSGDDFDSEEDSAKVRRAYDLLKSVFDKKDKYDIFCNRLAGRLRGLKSPKVCRHVQQLLVTVVADAEAGRYDNVPG